MKVNILCYRCGEYSTFNEAKDHRRYDAHVEFRANHNCQKCGKILSMPPSGEFHKVGEIYNEFGEFKG